MSQSRRRGIKYILRKKTEVRADGENKSHHVPRGEILEEVYSPDIANGVIALFDIRRQLLLFCPTEDVARLTDFHADHLIAIKSLEERYDAFQKIDRFEKPPRKGSNVFVVVKGKEFCGIVTRLRVSSSYDGGPKQFGVQVYDEVEVEEYGIPSDGSMTIEQDEFCFFPNGAVGVWVPLNKLRPRHESMEVQQSSHSSPHYPNKLLTVEKRLRRCERELNDAKSLINSQQTSLAEEQAAHEETKTLLVSILNELDEKERDFISSEEISDEFERELTIQHELHKALDLKTKELERQLDCERKAKKDGEDRLQNCEEKLKEHETTLATAQKSLKNKRESEQQCDWILKREEIKLTEEKLGSGTFGTVHKGTFRRTQVAIKKVKKKPIITEYNEENFRREMKMAARCRHPCMLQFIGATSDDESPLLVTELLDTSLKDVLLERALELTEIKIIALDVAKGLNYLHLNQPNPIVHRDISSGNVLLWKHGESWRGKVSDYGSAVLMNYARTGSGGAFSYLAPEIENQRFSTKSDVYSYGVLLLEMCRRREPSCLDDRDKLTSLVENATLRSLIRRCLQQNLKQRPSMDEIITILNRLTV